MTSSAHRLSHHTLDWSRVRPEGYLTGTMRGVMEAAYEIDTGHDIIRAKRAASCLLDPKMGDRVLLIHTAQETWLLAVLEKADPHDAAITFPGNLHIQARSGHISVVGGDGMQIVAGECLAVTTHTLEARAQHTQLFSERLTLLGSELVAEFERLKLFTAYCESLIGRLIQRLQSSVRKIEETETVRAGRLDLNARTEVFVHGTHTMVTARELVKVDAEHIHIG